MKPAKSARQRPRRLSRPRRAMPVPPHDEFLALKKLASTFSCLTSEEYFVNVSRHLARSLKVAYAFIGELLPGFDRVRVLGGVAQGKPMASLEYDLAGTPCEKVVDRKACCFPAGVQKLFPNDPLLVKLGVQGYVGAPLFDRTGKPLGIVVVLDTKPLLQPQLAMALFKIFSNRTEAEMERRRAEAAILEWKKRHEILTAATGQIVYELNRTTGRMKWSATAGRMLGLSSAELDNRVESWESRLHPDDRPRVLDLHETAETQRIPYSAEYRLRHQQGGYRWIHDRGCPLPGQPGTEVIFVGVMEDVSAAKRSEEDRLQLERKILQTQKLESLAVLAGGIAHDFNNILTAILGNISLALMDLSPVSPAREQLVEAEKATGRAAELVKQMLAYSGKGRFVVQRVDLREVVKEMAHMLEASISRQVTLRQDFANPLPTIEVDVNQLRQVIMNLVVNASEAVTAPNGIITLGTGAMECTQAWLADCWPQEPISDGLYVYLEVLDTGCGIAPELMSRIFDPFFSTKFTGRGLGLAAVLGIMRGHKGAIKVRSEPGKGSAFRVLFPAVAMALPAPQEKRVPNLSTSPGRGLVLLVDDEESIRQVGRKCLERLGFKVVTASSGEEAVAVFRNRGAEFTCVVLDLLMPGMDGHETFIALRRLRRDVRIFFCTGYDEETVRQQFDTFEYGGVIKKPFTMDKLQEMLGA
jgi:PAS domain S-box-containing protein